MRKIPMAAAIGFLLILVSSTGKGAEQAGKALLIGIERYEKAMALAFVGNDVRSLSEALSDGCGYDVKMIIDSAIMNAPESISPTTHRDAVMRRIESWIAERRPEETAILYFSGHGFLGPDGRLYLAVIDCDPVNPVPGGISVAWLRDQLRDCPAGRKILFLDACHSGSAKGSQARSVSAKAIAVEFAGVTGVTTLASCQGDESSYLWPMKKHSLFSYWLTKGVEGHADADSNGQITFNELAEFVIGNVSAVAESALGQPQTPVVVGDGESDEALTLTIKPQPLARLIADMADQLDIQIRCERFPAVGVVPSFTCGETGAELNLDFGTLPAYVATRLREHLATKGRGAYRIISENAMREALREKDAGPGDIGASKTRSLVAKGIAEQIPIPVVVSGRIRNRQGAVIRLSSNLIDTAYMSDIASAGGTALLTESERAMIPDSVSQLGRPAPHPPQEDSTAQPSGGRDDAVQAATPPAIAASIRRYDETADGPHPLSDPTFPFRVSIYVKTGKDKYVERKPRFDGNKCFVTLDRGEVYGIWVENRTDEPVFMRLLVDGLDTLPQKTKFREKGAAVEPVEGDGTVTVAPRVSLEETRTWHLDPHVVNSVRGFFEGGEGSKYEFKVVDIEESAAAKQNYTENIGLITAAFYREESERSVSRSPGEGTRRFGTGFGERSEEEVEHYTGDMVPGKCLAVLHIRYEAPSDASQ